MRGWELDVMKGSEPAQSTSPAVKLYLTPKARQADSAQGSARRSNERGASAEAGDACRTRSTTVSSFDAVATVINTVGPSAQATVRSWCSMTPEYPNPL